MELHLSRRMLGWKGPALAGLVIHFDEPRPNFPGHTREVFWSCQIYIALHHNHSECLPQGRRALLVLGG